MYIVGNGDSAATASHMANDIAMDVLKKSGIEHLILKSGLPIMGDVKGILSEVKDDFHEQAEQCKSLLAQSGFILKDKRHSEMIANPTSGFQNSFNEIWVRP